MGDRIFYRSGYKYQLVAEYCTIIDIWPDQHIETDFINLSTLGFLEIKKGYAWDGPSGPALDTGDFMRASLVHDALYQLMREGKLDHGQRKQADRILYELCLADGMNPLRAAWVYAAVRSFAAPQVEGKNDRKIITAP